ncbi:hypothetical protein BGZ51_004337 [Haplosporangium sp. Z 767]|nr:hypothetical protein BGZ51_004337 [Haplosporangium sp. Z 767]
MWLFVLEEHPHGFHDIVLGISTKDLHIDTLESITFSIATEDGISTGPCEIVSKHELKPLLMSPGEDVIKLRLHQRLEIHAGDHAAMIVMEIRTMTDVFSDLKPGSLDLHFMELYDCQQLGYTNDLSIRVHRPFLWSLSVVDGDHLGKSSNLSQHKKIINFAIAGDGTHAATLAATELGLLLDLWDVGYATELCSNIDIMQLNMEDMYRKHPLSRPTRCARVHVPVAGLHEAIHKLFKVSVSWDASQIAIIDASASMEPNSDGYQSAFSVFRLHKQHRSIKTASPPQDHAVLVPSEDYQHCESLQNLCHFGRFHITATRGQDIENELFVVFDGSSVQIFSVFGNWKHVRTIILDQPNLTHPTLFRQPEIDLAIRWRLIKSLRGRYFAWAAHHDNVVSAWDMENGSMVTFFVRQRHPGVFEHLDLTSICFSSDGSTLAIHGGGYISTYRTSNGTMLASFQVSGLDGAISDIRFIRGDTQIMFDTKTVDEDYGRGRLAFLLDASDMTLLDRVSLPGKCVEQPSSVLGSIQNLYTSHGPNLDFIRLDSRIVKSYSQPELACDERCFTHLSPLSHHSDEICLTSGLCFKAELRLASAGSPWYGSASPCIVVLASQDGDDPVEKLVIPSAQDRFGRLEDTSAVFLNNPPRFLVASKAMLMIWTLPVTLDGELRLALAWCIRSHRRNVSPDRVVAGSWTTCLHNQVYIRMRSIDDSTQTLVEKVIRPRAELAFYREDYQGIVFGMMFLITTFYKGADETCKKSFLRYVGSHINSYYQLDNPDKSLLAMLCLSWTPEYQDAYEQFFAAMLGSSYGRWVPGQGLARSSGALLHLLLKTEKEPRAMGLIEIIIDYCIRQARDEKDLYFLVPIRPCLHYFANHKLQTHADLALRILQRLAFFPVKSRSFVIDHHIIVHFPPTQWGFWGSDTPPLHLCKDPVLQLTAKMQHNHINYNFTRDLFVAAFDMLWVHKDEVNTGPNLLQPVAVEPQFSQPWRHTLIHTLWYMCKLRTEAVIVCHDFSLEALDNPAIAALIEYKW